MSNATKTADKAIDPMVIRVVASQAYGKEILKPHPDCKVAQRFLNVTSKNEATRRTTFDRYLIDCAKALGFRVIQVPVLTEETEL